MLIDYDSFAPVIDTRNTPANVQLETWREVMWDFCCPMTCEAPDQSPFRARLLSRELGSLGLRHMWSDPYKAEQTTQTLARSRRELFVLTVPTAGRFEMRQYGRVVELQGVFASLHSTMDTLEFVHGEPSGALIITIPAGQLRKRMPIPEDVCAFPIFSSGPLASVFFGSLRSAVEQIDLLDETQKMVVSEKLIDLLAMAIEADVEAPAITTPSVRARHLRRVKSYMISNMHQPDLSARTAAKQIGVSARYLHDLFRDEPQTIGIWLRQKRLEQASEMLADPSFSVLTVSEIAYRHGFRSNTHFATCFRGEFACTPKQWRERLIPRTR